METPEEFWALAADTEKPEICWRWLGHGSGYKGYGGVWYGRRQRLAHRVAWEISRGPIPDGLCVCHTCDNPGCVNPAHLWIGTNADNVRDRTAKGRTRVGRGERNAHAKLTEGQVREIRKSLDAGLLQREIAKAYQVSGQLVSAIKTGAAWGWLV